MTSRILDSVRATVAALLLTAGLAHAADAPAEYAARWAPADGGPKTFDEIRTALKLKGSVKETRYAVQYYEVAQPADLPAGYKATGRERLSTREIEATYKIRGDAPADTYLAARRCPLRGDGDRADKDGKLETDVLVTGRTETRMYSYSCSVKSTLARALQVSEVRAKGCKSDMKRVKVGDVKIERWTFADDRVVFDVSWNATTAAKDLARFRVQTIEPLITSGAKLTNATKTEMGSTC